MILKYALFTLTVSAVPIFMIFRDLNMNYNIFTVIIDNIHSISDMHFAQNILSVGPFNYFLATREKNSVDSLYTKEMLEKYSAGDTLYLAILGNVFDVSKATKYYGPGETYNVFTGRDGSRAFVTGDFTAAGLTDDVEDLSFQELRSLNDWVKFYHKEYTYKGKLIGRFYDKDGKPTGYYHRVQLRMEEAAKDEKDKHNFKLMFPPCNVEWTPEDGSRVWCSTRSGGIERDWVGVPRKLYEPGAETYRCACINTSEQAQVISPETGKVRSGNLEEYEDCHPLSTSCYVTTDP